jgi:putative ABC transport system permease protein
VKTLDRKLLRELRASKALIMAITGLMAVGVMAFIYMRSAHANLNRAKDDYYSQCRMADFWIDVKKAPLSELQSLAELPGVSEVRPRIQFFATVDLDRVEEPLNGLVLSVPDKQRPIINDLVLKRGGYFTGHRRNEVLVNDSFAARHGLFPGQWIHLLLNNRREELFIVGTAISSEFVYLVGPGAITPDAEHFGVFYLPQSYAEEVFDFDGAANQVVGLLAPEVRDHPDEVLRQAERRLSSYGVFSTIARRDQPSNRFLSDEIRGLGTFAGIIPTIFLAVAALVLNVLMVRLIDQQRVIIGTLKGLGYSNAQVFLHFTKFGALIGLASGLMGCAMGYGMAEFITKLYRRFFEFPNLANFFYPGLYAAGLAISLCCALFGSMQGARVALRLQPADAMRPRPPAAGGRIWLERIAALWRRLGFGWRMVLRNLVRHRLRTTVGIFATAMGAGLMTAGFMLREGVKYIVDFQFAQVMRSDVDLNFKDERGIEAAAEARHLPGVDRAEPVLDVACEFFHGRFHHKGAISGLADDARLTIPRDLTGRPVRVPSAGIVMTRKLAQLLDVSPGDVIEMEPIKGLRRHVSVPVVEIADSYVGIAVYANIHYLSRLIDEESAVSGVQLQVDSRDGPKRELFRAVKRLPAVQTYSSRLNTIYNVTETVLKTQAIFIGLLVLFAGVIFLTSLLNTSLIGLAERRREVATLRVLGYTEWQIGGFFLRESLLLTVLGTLLGMPLGYGLCVWVTRRFDTEMFRFPLVSPPIIWIRMWGFAFLFALLSHITVQRSINRMDWREALNVKE